MHNAQVALAYFRDFFYLSLNYYIIGFFSFFL